MTLKINSTGYKNMNICSICKGFCCKRSPAIVYPEDIKGELKTGLKAILETGKYCIDWWEGDPEIYFIRPATKGNEGKLLDPTWGGECTFLTEEGCSLEFSERPEGCRFLRPNSNYPYDCDAPDGHNKKHGADAWLPYQDMIKEIIEELE